jgi:ribosomal protein S18 acetylase RimI-like enzyme
MEIRAAQTGDAPGLAKLFLQFWEAHSDCGDPVLELSKHRTLADEKKAALRYMRKKDTHLIVAVEGGEALGYIEVLIKKNDPIFKEQEYGYLDSCVVNKWARRSGIGKMLIRAAFAFLRKKDIRSVKTNVYLSNRTASAFWKKTGFRPISAMMLKKI